MSNLDWTMDFQAVWQLVVRRRWVLLGAVAAGAALAFAILATQPERFTATAQIVIDTQEGTPLEGVDIAVAPRRSHDSIRTEVELIRSLATARAVVERLQLHETAFGRNAEPYGDSGTASRIQSDIADQILRDLSVRPVGDSRVIVVSYTGRNAEMAARIANAFVDTYVQAQLENKFSLVSSFNTQLSGRLKSLRDNVKDAQLNVEQYRASEGLLNVQGVSLVERQLAEVNRSLALRRAELHGLSARSARVRSLLEAEENLEALRDVVTSPTITNLRRIEADIIREGGEILAKYGPNHPRSIQNAQQSKLINQEIAAEVARISSSIEMELDVVRDEVARLEADAQALIARAEAQNRNLVTLRALERDADAKRAIYDAVLRQFEASAEIAALQSPHARVIARAVPSQNSAFPAAIGTMASALSGFAVVGLAIVIALEFFDHSIEDTIRIEAQTGAPVLSMLPMDGDKDAITPARDPVDGPDHDQRMRLSRLDAVLESAQHGPQVIAFHPADIGDAADVLALAFARVLAMSGRRVVLYADEPQNLANLGADGSAAETVRTHQAVLDKDRAINGVMTKDPATPLQILALKREPQGGNVLPPSDMAALLGGLRTDFDRIVVSAAPVLSHVNGFSVASAADANLLVATWGRTNRNALVATTREMSRRELALRGVVLIGVKLHKLRGFDRKRAMHGFV